MKRQMQTGATPQESFLQKWEWWAFGIATVVSFAVYVYSLAPTVTLEDCGELAVAGDYAGVPHPPGYPLWTILAYFFARVFSFVTFRGQPNPSWSIGLMSAVFGALATGLTAVLICRSGRDMLRGMRETASGRERETDNIIAWACGISASLLFAFSPVMWSQSNIVEVYSLNAFFVALVLLLGYAWLVRPSDYLLYAAAFALGLGLGNWWPSVLLTIMPLALVVLLKDIRLFRDFALVGMVIVGMILLNAWLKNLSQTCDSAGNSLHPTAGKWCWTLGPYGIPFVQFDAEGHARNPLMYLLSPFWIYTAINFIAIAAGWMFLPRGRTVAVTVLLVELGLLVYLFMPIVSDLRNPPMNWGYPRTWEGFLHAVGRGQYEKITPTDIFSGEFINQVGFYMSELRAQFTMPIALLGFFPFICWSLKAEPIAGRVSGLLVALVIAVPTVLLVGIENIEGIEDAMTVRVFGAPVRLYMPFAAAILALFGVGFVALALSRIRGMVSCMRSGRDTGIMEKIIIAAVLLGIVGLGFLYELHLFSLLIPQAGQPPAVVTDDGKMVVMAMMALPLLVTGMVAWLMFGKANLRPDIDETSQKWIAATIVCFLLMSVGMVVGANPKGDIQDMFIQRVKFITSHELYSYWIGYGMIFAMAFVEKKIFRNNPRIARIGALCAILLPIYPILENAPYVENGFNKELIRVYGGTDQRGHDFGWQFGNYQLQGMPAILSELGSDEAPPPNPAFPPPMGPNAIFFGGTDPGRFVPTYMIYSARVREDVYLITQNALADNTYMSVMRDLYGDRIWIPANSDANDAFRQFAEEVRAGKRGGSVDLRNGRVVVQGVDQVMAINGILCKMIHDNNKWKHDFYVEESYVIPWMYPYMEPHGLIIKLDPEPLPQLSPETVKNDMDFWAWYSRRLMNDPKFLYDAVAKKTFSKLRSAIAGIYEFRRMFPQAETAYKESIGLCPVSPEANFRLANMYMATGRIEEAKKVLSGFMVQDPNNSRIGGMLGQIEQRMTILKRKDELEHLLSSTGARMEDALELARVYREIGHGGFNDLLKNLLGNPNLPPDGFLAVAYIYRDAKMFDDMDSTLKMFFTKAPSGIPPDRLRGIADLYASAAGTQPQTPEKAAQYLAEASETMRRYLAVKPADAAGWHELGVMYVFLHRQNDAVQAFRQAVRFGGQKARDDLRKDPRIGGVISNPQIAGLLGLK